MELQLQAVQCYRWNIRRIRRRRHRSCSPKMGSSAADCSCGRRRIHRRSARLVRDFLPVSLSRYTQKKTLTLFLSLEKETKKKTTGEYTDFMTATREFNKNFIWVWNLHLGLISISFRPHLHLDKSIFPSISADYVAINFYILLSEIKK